MPDVGADLAYIDLLKKSLTDAPHEREFYWPVSRPKHPIKRAVFDLLAALLAAKGITLARDIRGEGFERPARGSGWVEATSACTLLGRQSLNNFQWCVEDVLNGHSPDGADPSPILALIGSLGKLDPS
jgi:hypothetical protein